MANAVLSYTGKHQVSHVQAMPATPIASETVSYTTTNRNATAFPADAAFVTIALDGTKAYLRFSKDIAGATVAPATAHWFQPANTIVTYPLQDGEQYVAVYDGSS